MRLMVWLTFLTAGASCIASADKTAPTNGAARPVSNVGRPGHHAFPPPPPPRSRLAPAHAPHLKQHRLRKKPFVRSHTKKTARKPLRRLKPRQLILPLPQRRDYPVASYVPTQALPEIVIKQAGPSKQFGWIGYGKHATGALPNVMALAKLPGWLPVGNSLFEAGLMYPGKPEKEPTVPYSAPASSISYNAPNPAASKPTYSAPEPSKQPSYALPYPADAPKAAVPASKPGSDVYSAGNPFNRGYQNPAPAVYNLQNSFHAPERTPPPPPPPPTTPPAPAYVPASTTRRPTTTTTSTTTTTEQPTYFKPERYRPKIFAKQPNVFTALKSSFPSLSASQASHSKPPPPPSDVFNIPVNVEEEVPQNGDGEVFYVFYEDDKRPSASVTSNQYKSPLTQNSVPLPAYVEDGPQELFNPPDDEDIQTIYVPAENAVNVPSSFDVSVGTSYGRQPPAASPSQRPVYKPGFPNFPANAAESTPTYDNPISSYDAPIYNDNSYTAKRPIADVLYREDAGRIRHSGNARKSRQPEKVEGSAPVRSLAAAGGKRAAPYGTRLGPRKQYEILGAVSE